MSIKMLLVVEQGTTFSQTINASSFSLNLMSYSCNGAIKKHHESTNSVAFVTSIDDANTVTISLLANTTSSLDAGGYVFDVIVTSGGGAITRIAEGLVTVTPTVI